MKKLLSIIILIAVSLSCTYSQTIPIDEDRIRRELESRGLEEEEVREKLLEKGVDIDNIDPTNLSEIRNLESVIEEAINELTEEKRALKEKEDRRKTYETLNKEFNDGNILESRRDTINNPELNQAQNEELKIKAKAQDEAKEIQEMLEKGLTIEEAIEVQLKKQKEERPKAAIYGQHIYRDKSVNFNFSDSNRPPDSYILGIGDQINVSIWGRSQEDADFEINPDGYIKPFKMPRISLKGISFGAAKKILLKRFDEYYNFRPEEFNVSLKKTRNITVNIVGEVFEYGSFTLPASNTAFNALVPSGGPTDIGSVRRIKLIRQGQAPKILDIYKFLKDPSAQDEFFLQDNDYIHVPVAEKLVTIKGSIKRPFTYELLDNENLKKLIEYAGGLNEDAYQSNIQIKRFENDEEIILDIDLRKLSTAGGDFNLKGGDEIVIGKIPTPYKNFAEISGAVELPGKYEIRNGMKIRDLLLKGVPSDDARKDIAYLKRENADQSTQYIKINIDEAISNPGSESNITLKAKDNLVVYSQTIFVDKDSISIVGAVRFPGNHPFDPSGGIKINDALLLAGGLRKDATEFAYILRTNPKNTKQKEYVRIDLDEIQNNPNSSNNITLEPLDSLVVYSTLTYLDESTVKISGAVRNPGEYQYDESLTLQDVITLAGGLKLEAATSRIDIFRVVIEENQPTKTAVATISVDKDLNFKTTDDEQFKLSPFDLIYVRNVPEFEFQRTINLTGEVKFPGPYALVDKNERLWSVIERAGGLTSEAFLEGATLYRAKEGVGFVVMNLSEVAKNKKSKHNYILKEGDLIEIPKNKDLVAIRGQTKAKEIYPDKILRTGKINVAYHKGKSAKWYVDKYAAGIGKDGRRKLITVEHPNGQIERTKDYLIFKKYPNKGRQTAATIIQFLIISSE